MEKKHTYKDTIKEAAELDENGDAERKRENRIDAEIAYETLALSSSMGMLGEEQTQADLLELAMVRQLISKQFGGPDEFEPGD